MAKNGKKTEARKISKKLAKQKKRELRVEADRNRFQRSDRKTLSEITRKGENQNVTADTLQKPEHSEQIVKSNAVSDSLAHKPRNGINLYLARQAASILAVASGIGFLIGLVFLQVEGGYEAVPAMGGVLETAVPIDIARLVFGLDTLFPIFFGAGLAVLATSLQSRGNRPLVRLILTTLLVAIIADFAENALVFKMMTGGGILALQWVATVIKYAALGTSSLMFSAILPVAGLLGWAVHVLLRYVFPLGIALLVSGLGGDLVRDIVGGSFPVSLLLIAIYAALLDEKKSA